jgi:hypothetical protein
MNILKQDPSIRFLSGVLVGLFLAALGIYGYSEYKAYRVQNEIVPFVQGFHETEDKQSYVRNYDWSRFDSGNSFRVGLSKTFADDSCGGIEGYMTAIENALGAGYEKAEQLEIAGRMEEAAEVREALSYLKGRLRELAEEFLRCLGSNDFLLEE